MDDKKKHLSILGIGPILCFPMVFISVIAVFLSIKGIIPFTISNKLAKILFIVVGVLLIIEGLICYLGADFGGGLVKSIKSNQLKINGSKWLKELYDQEYIDYCKRVNRCIPWFPKKNENL